MGRTELVNNILNIGGLLELLLQWHGWTNQYGQKNILTCRVLRWQENFAKTVQVIRKACSYPYPRQRNAWTYCLYISLPFFCLTSKMYLTAKLPFFCLTSKMHLPAKLTFFCLTKRQPDRLVNTVIRKGGQIQRRSLTGFELSNFYTNSLQNPF
jgi:hypothetical protein